MNEITLYNETLARKKPRPDVTIIYTKQPDKTELNCWVCDKINPYRYENGKLILNLATKEDNSL